MMPKHVPDTPKVIPNMSKNHNFFAHRDDPKVWVIGMTHLLCLKTRHVLCLKTRHVLSLKTRHVSFLKTRHVLCLKTRDVLCLVYHGGRIVEEESWRRNRGVIPGVSEAPSGGLWGSLGLPGSSLGLPGVPRIQESCLGPKSSKKHCVFLCFRARPTIPFESGAPDMQKPLNLDRFGAHTCHGRARYKP